MPDVITFGELLIDFVPDQPRVPLTKDTKYKIAAGGAPANVAAGLAKLGVSAGFIGRVGNDPFGHFLVRTLTDIGVDTSTVQFSNTTPTSLAIVSLSDEGEREFMFYGEPCNEIEYDEALMGNYIRTATIFHYGSISLINETARKATLKAIETATASENNVLISYDPNLRSGLWPDEVTAKKYIGLGCSYAQLVKLSEEEAFFLTGVEEPQEAAKKLIELHEQLRLVVITRGKKGGLYVTKEYINEIESSFPVKEIKDTTGAGDGFVAGLLKGWLESPQAFQHKELLDEICIYAGAVGTLTATEKGAIPALPKAEEVEEFLQAEEVKEFLRRS